MPPKSSVLLVQWRVMAYSKACFLSYKMRYHLLSKTAHLRSKGQGKEKHLCFLKQEFYEIVSRKKDDIIREYFLTIVLRIFWTSIWDLDSENRIRGSGEIHHSNCPFFAAATRPILPMYLYEIQKLTHNSPIIIYNEEFLRCTWSDFLNQGVKLLQLRTFSILWWKYYSRNSSHLISYLKLLL